MLARGGRLVDSLQSIPSRWSIEPAPNLVIRGQGPPVLLLHGWGASVDLFESTIAGLAPRYTLIAPDFPGFGRTPAPPSGWSVGDYTAWTISLLDELDIGSCAVVGHSFGGRVAIKLAAEWPERVTGLVLADAAGIKPKRTIAESIAVRKFKTLRRLSTSRVVPPSLRTQLGERVARAGSPDYRAAAGTVRDSFVRIVNEDLTPVLARIMAPTLLIWGEQDRDTPVADARVMERLIPDAGLVIFPGSGHYAYLEQPARFCHIVNTFLTNLPE